MSMFFDQYQRYKNVELIINDFRKNGEIFKILEVGANEHKNLEKFLCDDNIYYLDLFLPERLKKDPKYILGDATQMHFQDNEFDIIIALDVLEHIPRERREQFLREIDRVSSRLYIIAGPFYSESVSEAEMRVNIQYKCIFEKNHPWLIEHIENQLPELEDTLAVLETMERKISVFGHGDLRLWERLTNIQVVADINENFRTYSELIYDFYNKYLFSCDYSKEVYRTFLIGVNEEKEFKPNIGTYNGQESKKFDDIERVFWNMIASFGANSFDLKKNNSTFVFKCYYIEEGGSGFSEEQCYIIDYSSEVHEYFVNFEEKKITAVRIDLLDCNCIIGNFKAISEKAELNIISTNGLNIGDDRLIFTSNDPNIFIEVPEGGLNSIQVYFDVFIYNSIFINEISNLLCDKDAKLNELHKNNEKKFLEIQEQLQKKNNEMECQKKENLETQKKMESFWKQKLEQCNIDSEQKELQLKQKLYFLEDNIKKTEEELLQLKETMNYEIKQMEEEIIRMKESMSQAEEEKQQVINQIGQMYDSLSWKITKPIRVFDKIKK